MADGRVFFLNQPVEVFARQVLFGPEKYLQDKVSLPCAPKAGLLDMLKRTINGRRVSNLCAISLGRLEAFGLFATPSDRGDNTGF